MTDTPRTIFTSYRYGLLPPLDWDDICEREIALQRELWNRLVDIETDYHAVVERELRQYTKYADATDQIAALSDEIEALLAERREQRKAAQRKVATPKLDELIDQRIAIRRELYDTVKPLRKVAITNAAEVLRELSDRRYASIAAARQQSGLWWGNSNAVMASFDATLRRLEPWRRPRRNDSDDSEGRLTIQLQRGCMMPAFMAGARSEARLLNGNDPTHPERKLLVATVHSEGRGTRKTVTWPLLLDPEAPDRAHRGGGRRAAFPPGAMVKSLTISRRRSKPGLGLAAWRWSVSFALEIPAPVERAPERACGIDIGWRKVDGGVRVATIVGHHGRIEYVILPQDWLDRRAGEAQETGRLREEARVIALPGALAKADRERVRSLANALQTLPKVERAAGRDWLD
ncbi:MAG: hypothetical protein ACREDY_12460, partial [Bradyrhizobium sp.]